MNLDLAFKPNKHWSESLPRPKIFSEAPPPVPKKPVEELTPVKEFLDRCRSICPGCRVGMHSFASPFFVHTQTIGQRTIIFGCLADYIRRCRLIAEDYYAECKMKERWVAGV